MILGFLRRGARVRTRVSEGDGRCGALPGYLATWLPGLGSDRAVLCALPRCFAAPWGGQEGRDVLATSSTRNRCSQWEGEKAAEAGRVGVGTGGDRCLTCIEIAWVMMDTGNQMAVATVREARLLTDGPQV